jgi:uncharacterized protein
MKSRTIKEGIIKKSKSATGRIIVLTGARQTGKTTLAKMSFPGMKYIAVDDPVLTGQYTALTAAQWNHSFPVAILDEVQKAPSLIETIKVVHDEFPGTQYLLTGSSQLLLLHKIRETLAGRCAIFEIFPLTIPEIMTNKWEDHVPLSFFQKYLKTYVIPDFLASFSMEPDYAIREKALRYYLTFGGYPALVNPELNDDDRFEWLYGYIRTYLERDVRDLADFRSLEPFVKVQRMTSLMTGQLLNYSSLAKEAGVTVKTVQRFINYLDMSYQTIQLPSWSRNRMKRLVKSPKLHYLDPGVQKTIIQRRGEQSGNEFESAVFAEIYKQTRNINYPVFYYHLRTVDGREVDLLLETEKGYIAIEIKLSGRINKTDARHLINLETLLDKPVIHSFILSNDTNVKMFPDKILAIPAAMFLS